MSILHAEFPTVWQLIWKLINDYKGWDCSVFCRRTGLGDDIYYKARNNDKSLPTIQTIIIICVYMELDKSTAEELFTAAGIHLNKAIPTHRACMFVIYDLAEESIMIRIEFLNRLGFGKPNSRRKTSVKTL